MEDEIKIGEYVRTDEGYIYEFTKEINEDVQMQDFILCNDGKTKTHSFNIIDLIGEEDYVNGYRIIALTRTKENEIIVCIYKDSENMICKTFNQDNIVSILTKEQFANNQYNIVKE